MPISINTQQKVNAQIINIEEMKRLKSLTDKFNSNISNKSNNCRDIIQQLKINNNNDKLLSPLTRKDDELSINLKNNNVVNKSFFFCSSNNTSGDSSISEDYGSIPAESIIAKNVVSNSISIPCIMSETRKNSDSPSKINKHNNNTTSTNIYKKQQRQLQSQQSQQQQLKEFVQPKVIPQDYTQAYNSIDSNHTSTDADRQIENSLEPYEDKNQQKSECGRNQLSSQEHNQKPDLIINQSQSQKQLYQNNEIYSKIMNQQDRVHQDIGIAQIQLGLLQTEKSPSTSYSKQLKVIENQQLIQKQEVIDDEDVNVKESIDKENSLSEFIYDRQSPVRDQKFFNQAEKLEIFEALYFDDTKSLNKNQSINQKVFTLVQNKNADNEDDNYLSQQTVKQNFSDSIEESLPSQEILRIQQESQPILELSCQKSIVRNSINKYSFTNIMASIKQALTHSPQQESIQTYSTPQKIKLNQSINNNNISTIEFNQSRDLSNSNHKWASKEEKEKYLLALNQEIIYRKKETSQIICFDQIRNSNSHRSNFKDHDIEEEEEEVNGDDFEKEFVNAQSKYHDKEGMFYNFYKQEIINPELEINEPQTHQLTFDQIQNEQVQDQYIQSQPVEMTLETLNKPTIQPKNETNEIFSSMSILDNFNSNQNVKSPKMIENILSIFLENNQNKFIQELEQLSTPSPRVLEDKKQDMKQYYSSSILQQYQDESFDDYSQSLRKISIIKDKVAHLRESYNNNFEKTDTFNIKDSQPDSSDTLKSHRFQQLMNEFFKEQGFNRFSGDQNNGEKLQEQNKDAEKQDQNQKYDIITVEDEKRLTECSQEIVLTKHDKDIQEENESNLSQKIEVFSSRQDKQNYIENQRGLENDCDFDFQRKSVKSVINEEVSMEEQDSKFQEQSKITEFNQQSNTSSSRISLDNVYLIESEIFTEYKSQLECQQLRSSILQQTSQFSTVKEGQQSNFTTNAQNTQSNNYFNQRTNSNKTMSSSMHQLLCQNQTIANSNSAQGRCNSARKNPSKVNSGQQTKSQSMFKTICQNPQQTQPQAVQNQQNQFKRTVFKQERHSAIDIVQEDKQCEKSKIGQKQINQNVIIFKDRKYDSSIQKEQQLKQKIQVSQSVRNLSKEKNQIKRSQQSSLQRPQSSNSQQKIKGIETFNNTTGKNLNDKTQRDSQQNIIPQISKISNQQAKLVKSITARNPSKISINKGDLFLKNTFVIPKKLVLKRDMIKVKNIIGNQSQTNLLVKNSESQSENIFNTIDVNILTSFCDDNKTSQFESLKLDSMMASVDIQCQTIKENRSPKVENVQSILKQKQYFQRIENNQLLAQKNKIKNQNCKVEEHGILRLKYNQNQ